MDFIFIFDINTIVEYDFGKRKKKELIELERDTWTNMNEIVLKKPNFSRFELNTWSISMIIKAFILVYV